MELDDFTDGSVDDAVELATERETLDRSTALKLVPDARLQHDTTDTRCVSYALDDDDDDGNSTQDEIDT